MSVVNLTAVEGRGTSLDRTLELCEAIKAVIYDIGEGLPVGMVIGALAIAKYDILKVHEQ